MFILKKIVKNKKDVAYWVKAHKMMRLFLFGSLNDDDYQHISNYIDNGDHFNFLAHLYQCNIGKGIIPSWSLTPEEIKIQHYIILNAQNAYTSLYKYILEKSVRTSNVYWRNALESEGKELWCTLFHAFFTLKEFSHNLGAVVETPRFFETWMTLYPNDTIPQTLRHEKTINWSNIPHRCHLNSDWKDKSPLTSVEFWHMEKYTHFLSYGSFDMDNQEYLSTFCDIYEHPSFCNFSETLRMQIMSHVLVSEKIRQDKSLRDKILYEAPLNFIDFVKNKVYPQNEYPNIHFYLDLLKNDDCYESKYMNAHNRPWMGLTMLDTEKTSNHNEMEIII